MEGIKIFTDGSKSSDSSSVGTACILYYINISIFTAQCIGLYDALSIATQNLNSSNIIFTDSLSALDSLHNPKISVKTNPFIFKIKKKYRV